MSLFEPLLLAMIAIPLTVVLRPILSFLWAYLRDVIARHFSEKIDD
ncbi:MAG: hypothetical protein R3Y10_09440 [Ferrimonas sp.]